MIMRRRDTYVIKTMKSIQRRVRATSSNVASHPVNRAEALPRGTSPGFARAPDQPIAI
jgi:hypothetical protein